MRRFVTVLGFFAMVLGSAAAADEAIFSPPDHCVAYRTVKDLLFAVDAEIVGRNCEVRASLELSGDGGAPRIVVEVPIDRFRSRNVFRDRKVAELLGAKTQPELRFTSEPIDADSLRAELADGSLRVSGELTLGGKDFPVDFPVQIVERDGRPWVTGRLATTFAAFEVEVPTIAGGLIARPHEELELVVHLDAERVAGLDDWVRSQGLR